MTEPKNDNLNSKEKEIANELSQFTHDVKRSLAKRSLRAAKSYNDQAYKTPVVATIKKVYVKSTQPDNNIPSNAIKKTQLIDPSAFEIDPFFETLELPHIYHHTTIKLIARDPTWIYSYWELDTSSIETAQHLLGDQMRNAVYTLRLYDTTLINFNGSNANGYWDYDGLHNNGRYINVPNEDAVYCGEIGLRLSNGEFYVFARSNFIQTPRTHEVHRNDSIWTTIDEQRQSTFIDAKLVEIANDKLKKFELAKNNLIFKTKRFSLSVEDVKNYYAKNVLLAKVLNKKHTVHGKNFYIVATPSKGLKNIDIPGVITTKTQENLYTGASEQHVVIKEEQKKDFYFELATELIIRGRSEPDATIYWGKKKIQTQSDGSFEIHMDLNEGALLLDFLAQSQDQQRKKSIQTSVIRTKTIGN